MKVCVITPVSIGNDCREQQERRFSSKLGIIQPQGLKNFSPLKKFFLPLTSLFPALFQYSWKSYLTIPSNVSLPNDDKNSKGLSTFIIMWFFFHLSDWLHLSLTFFNKKNTIISPSHLTCHFDEGPYSKCQ